MGAGTLLENGLIDEWWCEMRRLSFGLVVCGVLAVAGGNFPNQVKWNTSVTDGYLDDVANWIGASALPGEGQTQTINMDGAANDVTVRVGAGTNLVQKAHFYVVAIPKGRKVTIDTTGGRYVQDAAHYESNWQGFGFFTSGTAHWCNFEGLNTAGGAPICSLDDAVLEAAVDASGKNSIELKRGTWNCHDPIPGGTLAVNTFMFGNNGDQNTAIFGEGGYFKGKTLTMRGGTVRVTGGNHELWGAANIGDAYAYNPRLEITGGSLGITNYVWMGNNKEKSSTLDVSGTGRLSVRGDFQMGRLVDKAAPVYAYFRGDSVSEIGTTYLGTVEGTRDAGIVLSDNARLTVNDYLNIANAKNCSNVVDVADHATLVTKSGAGMAANGADAFGALRVRENAVWEPRGNVTVGSWWTGSSSELTLTDSAQLVTDSSLNLQVLSNGRFALGDNVQVDAPNMWLEATGTNGLVELTGGTTRIRGLHVYGSSLANSTTNIMRVSGGTHTTVLDASRSYVALTVGNGPCHSRFEMTGGKLTMPRIVRVGYGLTGVGSAVFRMTGGEIDIVHENDTYGSAVFNVCDSTESNGRVELLGGVIRTQTVRGWTGARCRNGTGWAVLYADGGTIASMATPVDEPLVTTLDEALLGERGLTLDTTMKDAVVNQVFTDAAADVTGRVVKVGNGTLKVAANSTHGETVVAGGTLVPSSASITQFGRSLVITNGALFSLAGAPTTFTAERLTLGSDNSRGILALDPGDVITITGANGLTVGRGFIRCDSVVSQAGTTTFFRLANGATVDPAELAKLRVLNGASEYEYTFEVDGSDIKLKVAAWEMTATTWTGAASGDWSTAGNWNPSLPAASTEATFPANAANKTIAVSADAKAQALLVQDAYTFNGEDPLQVSRVAATAGTTTFNAGLSPSSSFLAEPSDGATIVLAGGIDSLGGSLFFSKAGSGLLSLPVASFDWAGDWILSGGTTRASVANALGPTVDLAAVLTVGAGTLAFAEVEQDYTRNVTFAAGAARGAVLDTEVAATLRGRFTASSGGLVKTGAGALTLSGELGGHTLALDDMGSGSNRDPDADIILPANGDGPEKTGLGGFSVLEGKVRLEGTGADASKTVFTQKQFTLIGGRHAATVNPELEVANCTFQEGDSGRHLLVGGTTPPTTAALAPTLRVVENGVVSCDTLRVGTKGHSNGSQLIVTPTLALTNGTVSTSFAAKFGVSGDNKIVSTLRIGTNGVLRLPTTSSSAAIAMDGNLDGEIADGGLLTMPNAGSQGLSFGNATIGQLRLVRGGRLTVQKITSSTWANGSTFELDFDGGVLELTGANTNSVVFRPETRPVHLAGAGAEFVVAAGKRHSWHLPVTGAAPFVKSGAGELVIGTGLQLTTTAGVAAAADFVPACWTGLTTVKEGTLTLATGGATNTLAVKVESGATLTVAGSQTLGAITGAGTVTGTNATETLACGLSVPWGEVAPDRLTFANVALRNVTVDFNAPAGESYKSGTVIPVATLGTGATADLATWKGVNAGPLFVTEFSQADGVVYGKVRASGMTLILR